MEAFDLITHWSEVRRDLIATLEKFEEADLTFRPFEGAWPAGQVMLHIAACEDWWLHRLVKPRLGADPEYPLESYPDKAAIRQVLDAASSRTHELLAGLDAAALTQTVTTQEGETFSIASVVWHLLEHEIHHRGELSLMLGLLGREGLEV